MTIVFRIVALACAALNLIGIEAAVANPAQFGLVDRPSNTSCVAWDKPRSDLSVATAEAFPNISISGPVDMIQTASDSSRWFIANRFGFVWTFQNDTQTEELTVVLDLSDRVDADLGTGSNTQGSQQWGITSIALHPDFPTQPYLFVATNLLADPADRFAKSRVSRFTSTDGGATFDVNSEVVLIEQEQDSPWHHLGQIAFGPDGYLYIAFGDGGDGVRKARSSNLNDLRGSMLRIDIDNGSPYSIPPTNPLVDTGFREEIFLIPASAKRYLPGDYAIPGGLVSTQ